MFTDMHHVLRSCTDRKSTRLNSSHRSLYRRPSSAGKGRGDASESNPMGGVGVFGGRDDHASTRSGGVGVAGGGDGHPSSPRR